MIYPLIEDAHKGICRQGPDRQNSQSSKNRDDAIILLKYSDMASANDFLDSGKVFLPPANTSISNVIKPDLEDPWHW